MKKLKILLVSLLTTACGSKAFANSDCGDPSKGKFTCDTDQISLEYTEKEIKQNGWFNRNAGSGAFVYGPYLDLDAGVGRFKEKSVHASIPISADGGRGTYPCTASSANAGMLLYTVQLTATSMYGTEAVLDSKNVYRTWNGNPGWSDTYLVNTPQCAFGVTFSGDPDPGNGDLGNTGNYGYIWFSKKYINLSLSRVPANYTNFQIKVKNVHSSVTAGSPFSPIQTFNFYGKEEPIFLNINGFR